MEASGRDDDARRADPDRWLSTRFIADPIARADVLALYAFDRQLARAQKVASNPLIAEIRLTWWREAVDEIFAGGRVRGHPVALALRDVVARRDLAREGLIAMIDARIDVLEAARLDLAAAVRWADDVGGSVAVAAARILDPAARPKAAAPAGRVWGLTMLAGSPRTDRSDIIACIRDGLRPASEAARGLGVAAFPSVAYVTLARGLWSSTGDSALKKRLRLLWAVASGRL